LDLPITVYEDNQSVINLLKTFENNKCVKHIELKYFFVKDEIEKGNVKFVYVKTTNQLADIFTKPLNKVLFERHRLNLGLTYE